MSNDKKILILHDRFKFKGGAERLVLTMAQALNADIATEYWNESSFAPQYCGAAADKGRAKIIILGKQIRHLGLSYFSAQWRFFWKTKFIRDYDIIIFSGNNCLSAAWRARSPLLFPPLGKGRRLIMYCHTPVRYAYDLKNYYYQKMPAWQKPLFLFFVIAARLIYQWGISKMDLVLANSRNVQARLKYYCGIDSQIVYPPIDIEKFQHELSFPRRHDNCHSRGSRAYRQAGGNPVSVHKLRDPRLPARNAESIAFAGGRGDDKEETGMTEKKGGYYLSFGRLDPLKRVDDIVRAFKLMPDKNLIVASGGPELERIRQIARGSSNIEVLGFVSDEKLAELVSNCIANIYIPQQEDFGMTPLEAAAAGKPTIGVDDGGLRETIINQKTGYLLPKDYSLEDLVKAVQWLDADRAGEMRRACEEQAQRFSKERFIEEIRNHITHNT